LLDEMRDERERQVSMRDRHAKRPTRCSLRIGVDPLLIQRRLRELIDLFLRHHHPRTRAEIGSLGVGKLIARQLHGSRLLVVEISDGDHIEIPPSMGSTTPVM
jgi:hypothetical protein